MANRIIRGGRVGRLSTPTAALTSSDRIVEREGAIEKMVADARKDAAEAAESAPKKTAVATTRVRMLTTRRGSPDGVHAILYETGRSYDLPDALAVPYLAKGYAERDKMIDVAPERKGTSADAEKGREGPSVITTPSGPVPIK